MAIVLCWYTDSADEGRDAGKSLVRTSPCVKGEGSTEEVKLEYSRTHNLGLKSARENSNHMRINFCRPLPGKEMLTFSASPRETFIQSPHLPPCFLQFCPQPQG